MNVPEHVGGTRLELSSLYKTKLKSKTYSTLDKEWNSVITLLRFI